MTQRRNDSSMKQSTTPNPDICCDITYCVYNMLWDGKRECRLNYLIRDKKCPYKQDK